MTALVLAAVFYVLGALLMAWRFRATVGVDMSDDPGSPVEVPEVSWLVAVLWPVVVLLLAAADCYLAVPRRPRR